MTRCRSKQRLLFCFAAFFWHILRDLPSFISALNMARTVTFSVGRRAVTFSTAGGAAGAAFVAAITVASTSNSRDLASVFACKTRASKTAASAVGPDAACSSLARPLTSSSDGSALTTAAWRAGWLQLDEDDSPPPAMAPPLIRVLLFVHVAPIAPIVL